jgi:hypothetical protein
VVAVVVGLTPTSSAVNFHQCLDSINNMTIDGKTDNHGNLLPPSTSNATAITYDLCVSQCGAGQEPFQWTAFSQLFSSWLLPWLALLSQLPFGANDKLDNLESMLLTLGSPTLAAYSLALTVLNGRWIAQLFSTYRYPNVKNAVRILNSLQQSPLRVDTDGVLLAATSIAWVIIAYVFTIIDYFSQGIQHALNSNGGSIGSLLLWLLPIVIGWLQLSPKCDSIRLHQAVDRANSIAYVASPTSQPIKASNIFRKRGISIKLSELDEARLDERSTPPIYNYARFLPWVQAVVIVSDAFGIICERDYHHDPVVPGTEWRERNDEGGDTLTALQVKNYSLPRPGSAYLRPRNKWGLDSSAVSRMFIASALALTLQWGTTGAAVIIIWFTPTIGEHIETFVIPYLAPNPSLSVRSKLPVSVIHHLWRTLYSGLDDASYVQYPDILFDQHSYLHISRAFHAGTPGSGRSLAFDFSSPFRKGDSSIQCCIRRRHRVVTIQQLP